MSDAASVEGVEGASEDAFQSVDMMVCISELNAIDAFPPHLWDPVSGAGNGKSICNFSGLLWDAVPPRMGSILHFSRLWVGSCGG